MKILVTPTSFCKNQRSKAFQKLQKFCPNLILNETGRPLGEDDLISKLEGCDGFLAGLDYITAKVLTQTTALKAISRYGAGVDRVDIEAAKEKGILVSNTPGVNAVAVAELAFGLMMSLARRIPMLDHSTKSGEWVRSTGIEISGKTLGIIGLGAIGKHLAAFASGFSMNVMAYDPFLDTAYANANQIIAASFEQVLHEADIISLHLPLNHDTYHFIDRDALAKVKSGAIIINTSRGGMIDEDAAYEALTAGKLGGLGLDAFEQEPPQQSPLFGLDNVVLTPHTGAHTEEAIEKMSDLAVDNLIDMLTGQPCQHIIR